MRNAFVLAAALSGLVPHPAAAGPLGPPSAKFLEHVRRRGVEVDLSDPLALRVVSEFGAVFVTRPDAVAPPTWMFFDPDAVVSFQTSLAVHAAPWSASIAELQKRAGAALASARAEAASKGLSITPNGPGSAQRSYADTERLWRSRLEPGLAHWVRKGELSRAEADRILALAGRAQVAAALALEDRGLWLSTRFDKSILYSVAAPGTSQHLAMLAIDVAEHTSAPVRKILARHGWHQTVYSDLPHFTFVGVAETELPSLGLVGVTNAGRTFWLVDAPRPRGGPELDLVEECPF
jgi:hypothetical protein